MSMSQQSLYVSVYAQPYILHDSKAKLRLETFDNQTDRIVRPRSLATPVEIFVRTSFADATSETSSACGNSCNEPDECIDSKCIPSPTSYVMFEHLSKPYEHYYALTGTSTALDPAFNETDYAKYEITGQGPAYTEPYVVFNSISQNTTINIFTLKHRYWEGDYGPTLGVRIYLSDQGTFEWVTFIFGVLFLCVLFLAFPQSSHDVEEASLYIF